MSEQPTSAPQPTRKPKHAPKLGDDARALLLTWIGAGYRPKRINALAAEANTDYASLFPEDQRDAVTGDRLPFPPPVDPGLPLVSRQLIDYYRDKYTPEIERLRAERHTRALDAGLAITAERVARLQEHAEQLESIMWVPDKNGRMWNAKAWRETLADIAAETGGRKGLTDGANITITVKREQPEQPKQRDDDLSDHEVAAMIADHAPNTTPDADDPAPAPAAADDVPSQASQPTAPSAPARRLLPEELDDDAYD